MKNKQEAALKIIKLLNLYNNLASSSNKKEICKSKVIKFCEEFNFKIINGAIL